MAIHLKGTLPILNNQAMAVPLRTLHKEAITLLFHLADITPTLKALLHRNKVIPQAEAILHPSQANMVKSPLDHPHRTVNLFKEGLQDRTVEQHRLFSPHLLLSAMSRGKLHQVTLDLKRTHCGRP